MKLYGIRIFVDDFDKAHEFYSDLLALPTNWRADGMRAAGYGLENAELIVEEAKAAEKGLVGRFVGISMTIDNIDAAYETLSGRGVRFEGPPEKQEWGGTLAHFRDPAGNVLTLLEQGGDARDR